jgi:heme/copper-type cytochrome/quinol oxidase subunit 3
MKLPQAAMQICLPLTARVGAHAVHAIAALLLMAAVWLPLRRGLMPVGRFQAAPVFWYLVVGIWPLIIGMNYLR